MMLALLAILLRPFYLSKIRQGMLLLTPMYDKKSVDSVLSKKPFLSLYHIEGATPYSNSALLDSYSSLEDPEKNLRVVAGQGLPSYILPRIKNSYDFLPSPEKEGVVELFLPNTIRKNSPTSISGTFYTTGKKVKLYLESPSGKEDSIIIKAPGTDFELSFVPKVEGRVVYKLTVMDSTGTKSSDDIPLEVDAFEPLNILIAQGYPTFEMQYLKNFLSRQQHQIALRFQLSKQVFRTEYANRTGVQLNRFTKKLLDEADLIILDHAAVSGISHQERTEITSAVHDGLGLLVLMSGDGKSIPSDFLGAPMKKVSQDTSTVMIAGKSIKFPVAALRPIATDGLQTILGNNRETLAGYRHAFKGRIGFQLLQETYRLKLSGDSLAYGWIWSPLIDAVARSSREGSQPTVTNPLPVYVNEPITINLMSSANRPAVSFDSITLPLREDVLLDDLWSTTTWTDQPGWHSIQSADGTTRSHYVFNEGEWSSLRHSQLIRENIKASRHQSVAPADGVPVEKEYPPVYFFIAFILAAGFLWLAPKL